jgi:RNA polymerase primary sigma factor
MTSSRSSGTLEARLMASAISALLKMAVTWGDAISAAAQVERGADPNGRDSRGRTALMIAANKGHDAVCEVLLRHGAGAEEVDESGRTAFDMAQQLGHRTVIEVLQRWRATSPVPSEGLQHASIDEPVADLFGAGGWESEPEVAPLVTRERTDEVTLELRGALEIIQEFVPDFGAGVDWSDVDIALPEPVSRRSSFARLDPESVARVSATLSGALDSGFISIAELEKLAKTVRNERPEEFCRHLALALSDVGVSVHNDLPAGWPEDHWPSDGHEGANHEQVNDLMRFLGDLASWRNDPMATFSRNARRSPALDRTAEFEFGSRRDALVQKIELLIGADQVLREKAENLRSAAISSNSQETEFEEDDASDQEEVDALPIEESEVSAQSSEDDSQRFLYDPSLLRALAFGLSSHQFSDFMAAKEELSDLFERFVSSNIGLVHRVVKRYQNLGLDYSDLFQEGCIGLMRAAVRFDHNLGFKFSTFATWWIRQAMTRAIGDRARTIRVPVHMHELLTKIAGIRRRMTDAEERDGLVARLAQELTISAASVRKALLANQDVELVDECDSVLRRYLSVPSSDAQPDDIALDGQVSNVVGQILSELTAREARVIRLRFGIGTEDSMTLEEVGKEYGVTRERIRQIEAKALRKLRHPSRLERFRDVIALGDLGVVDDALEAEAV